MFSTAIAALTDGFSSVVSAVNARDVSTERQGGGGTGDVKKQTKGPFNNVIIGDI